MNELVLLPIMHVTAFWILSVAWSLFQGYSGYVYGLFIHDAARKEKTGVVRQLAYGIHHAAMYLVCSMSGFAAWSCASYIAVSTKSQPEMSVGMGAVLIALASITVTGVSGALPRLLFFGNRPVQ